ncbi:MAG: methionine--tRNA ligase [Patescibacteria group bacterium]|nr:methionine--tRNA ligase [Patescibacteria group bacterium]MDD5490428.1 methionine--tRNA ligase [Patescibacteria group bacterium]
MSNKKGKFYITTPIYYVNANPHIGHTYTTVAADVLARYHRLIGDKTFFLTGTDEHGTKIEEKAKEAGLSPQKFVDGVAAQFELAWDNLNISHDRFIRTTEAEHMAAVQNALQYMYDKGDIYPGKYEGLYCRGCEQFKNEKDLIDGKCPDHKTKPEWMSEECYMFKLSKYQKELLKKIESDEFKISPKERKNEVISFYKNEGLKDVAFSRKNVKWGIPLPWDKSQTTYVWADAFLNYLTGLDWEGSGKKSPEFWPPDVQLMSKDILRVHATIWPAMLLSLGLELPKELFIHGFFLVDGQKMSKSLGNVIAPEDLVKKYGVDATRYLLMSATSFGSDGDIGWEFFDEKYTADLANGLGNLVARATALFEKMEEAGMRLKNNNQLPEVWGDFTCIFDIDNTWESYKRKMGEIALDRAPLYLISGKINDKEVQSMIAFLDNYISTTKPWELIKNKDERTEVVMYNVLERTRHIALMIYPFMPETADKILEQLGQSKVEEIKDFKRAMEWGGLKENAKIKKGEILFPRLDK